MGTLYLMQTFDEMGYYKDNGANVKFEYFPVYSDAMTAFNTCLRALRVSLQITEVS